jgi:signal transduction histidine kinase/ActR/RegA family two-component response regulator
MLHPSHRRSMRQAGALIGLMALGLLLALWAQRSTGIEHFANYLPTHTLVEMVSVVIAVLVFASGWNAYSRTLPSHAVILACAFLGVAALDFTHAMSYPGMPPSNGSASFQRTIAFWLSARLLAAVALLAAAVLPVRPMQASASRYRWLVAVMLLVMALHALFLLAPQWTPVFFDEHGLTWRKLGTEYLIIGLNLATAWVLWRAMAQPQPFNAAALFGAVCAMALGECFFTLYSRANDFYNLVGHGYKIVSYLFLYRAVFVEVIEGPYQELRAVRDQLRAMLDAVPDVMLELDLQGRYHAVHCARPELLIRPADVLLRSTVHQILPAAQAGVIIKALEDAMDTGVSSGAVLELPFKPESRWYELSVARKGEPDGENTRFIVLSRDITERKQAEAVVLEQKAATHASRARNEFLSRVSHELRTPLNAVIGFAQLLLHTPGSSLAAGQKLHIEYILRAGHHLLDMINDILDLTRIESGETHLAIEPVSLSELLKDTVPMVQTQAEAMGLSIRQETDADTPDLIMGDRRCLKQALINVLSNAVKYNQIGGTVSIRCRRSPADAEQVDVVIADSGMGLTAEQQKGLFEPFNRLGADQSGIEGTGLGLVITRRVIEAMQGAIRLESTHGVGTVVTLTLPQAPQAADAQPAQMPRKASEQTSDAAEPRHVATVLCVEDNPLNAALLRAIFDLRPSVKLLVAEDGRQALERLKRGAPDLVLIDMNLPDMNGAEVLQRMRQTPQGRDALCIAMSADVLGDPLSRARQQGFADFWPKPLDVNGVLRRLDVVLASLDVRQGQLWPATDIQAPLDV